MKPHHILIIIFLGFISLMLVYILLDLMEISMMIFEIKLKVQSL